MLKKEIIIIHSNLYKKHATIYRNSSMPEKAVVLYFHGGGLIYSHREDLPDFHIQELCNAGYIIAAMDYPLAPAVKIEQIFHDVRSSIQFFIEQPEKFSSGNLPYFLWGRSAGAYLCLLAAAQSFSQKFRGIISYYGYGFLTDYWFNHPSPYYCRLPMVSKECLPKPSEQITCSGNLDTCYSHYVYARQQGCWIEQFFQNREKYFYRDYSLRLSKDFSSQQAVFLAHSTNDTDVPYEEFLALGNLLKHSDKFIVSDTAHDFDRFTENRSTRELIAKTIQFLDQNL